MKHSEHNSGRSRTRLELPLQLAIDLPAAKTGVLICNPRSLILAHRESYIGPGETPVVDPTRRLIGTAREAGVQVGYVIGGLGAHLTGVAGSVDGSRAVDSMVGELELEPVGRELVFDADDGRDVFRVWLNREFRDGRGVFHLVIAGALNGYLFETVKRAAGIARYHTVMAEDCVSALGGATRDSLLRDVAYMYDGHVCSSWRDLRFVSNSGRP